MIKVLFVCHGNVCRSPMAEFVLKDMMAKRGIAEQFEIASAATSTEELGNGVHHGTRTARWIQLVPSVLSECSCSQTSGLPCES